jgi:ATP-dependent DNA helicase RecQ
LLRTMISYAESSSCRHDQVLDYFEDVAEELGGCGHCDNCIAAAAGRIGAEPDEAASAEAVRAALAAIRPLPFAVGAGVLASYLIGEKSRQVLRYDWQTRDAFGVLREHDEQRVRRLLRRFIAAGLLALDPEHATLRITRRAAEVIAGTRENPVRLPPTAVAGAASAASLNGDELALFERLRQWRMRRAQADGVPAYGVCQDVTLRAIAAVRPSSSEALLAITGMGPARVERYGAEILAELSAHEVAPIALLPAEPGRNFSQYQLRVRQEHPRAFERWSDEEDQRVIALAGSGKTPDDIAAELQRQPNAIVLRMEKLGLIEPAQTAT